MRDILVSSAIQPLTFYMALTSDGKSPATGLSPLPTVTLSKNGGSFASPSGTVTEIGNGWYKVAGNTTDSGMLGPLILHATATACDNADREWSVVAYNPQFDLGILARSLVLQTGTAVAGSSNSITLQTALGADNLALNMVIAITGGTGAGQQSTTVTSYTNSTKIATVAPSWAITPDTTSTYAIIALPLPLLSVLGKVTFGNTTLSGSVGSVTGNLGGNVNGNVIGSVGSVTGNVSGSTASVIGDIGGDINGNVIGNVQGTANVSSTSQTSIASAIWKDTIAGDFTVAGSIGKSIFNAFIANTSTFTVSALQNAPTGGGAAPTVSQIDDRLSSTHGAGLWGGAAGSGIYQIVQPVHNATGGNMQGVRVTMYDGATYFTALSDTGGNATFQLDAAVYSQSVGGIASYNFTNNGNVTVSSNATLSAVVGTAIFIAPPVDPADCTVYFVAHSAGALLTNNIFEFTMDSAPQGSGNVYIGEIRTATSDPTTALVTVALSRGSGATPCRWLATDTATGKTWYLLVPDAPTFAAQDVTL